MAVVACSIDLCRRYVLKWLCAESISPWSSRKSQGEPRTLSSVYLVPQSDSSRVDYAKVWTNHRINMEVPLAHKEVLPASSSTITTIHLGSRKDIAIESSRKSLRAISQEQAFVVGGSIGA